MRLQYVADGLKQIALGGELTLASASVWSQSIKFLFSVTQPFLQTFNLLLGMSRRVNHENTFVPPTPQTRSFLDTIEPIKFITLSHFDLFIAVVDPDDGLSFTRLGFRNPVADPLRHLLRRTPG